MSIVEFHAEADIVGHRIKVTWDFDVVALGQLSAIPSVTVRRKRRDFEYPSATVPDPFLVYDSSAFPPAGTVAVDLPGWEERESERRIIVTVESASRLFAGRRVEVLRRTIATTYDLYGRPLWRRIILLDYGDDPGGLQPGTCYYYQIFSPIISPGDDQRKYRAVTAAGEAYGMGKKIYDMLPALYHRHDVLTRTPTPDGEGVPELASRSGQLRRFMDPFGAALDLMRSSAEGLQRLRDIDNVDYRYLSLLARWIGWDLSFNESIPIQRHETKYAPALYKLIGSIPGCIVWAERLTGWDCQVKEFIHNVFRTNVPEAIQLWEIWQRRFDGSSWSENQQLTFTDGFDGRPTLVRDATDTLWMFWHSDRSQRNEIWLQRLDGVDPEPQHAMSGTVDDIAGISYSDEHPATVISGSHIWLFWNSDRAGRNDIWMRLYDGLPGGAPVRLTDEQSEDNHPAAVVDLSGNIWLFWQSDRRGRMDLWSRVYDGVSWGEPTRLTTAQYRDETPAAAVDASGRVWLFWNRLMSNHSEIMYQIYETDHWTLPQSISDAHYYGAAPAATWWDSQMWVFWQSTQADGSQIWGQRHDGLDWQTPFKVSQQIMDAKEPAVVIDGGGELRVMWRSQEGGRRYHSLTIDVDDDTMLSHLKSFNDRVHYTIDTGVANEDWYAPNNVGLYFSPDTTDEAIIAQKLERVRRFMEPFRPLTTRFVWLLDSIVYEELIDTDATLTDEILLDEVH